MRDNDNTPSFEINNFSLSDDRYNDSKKFNSVETLNAVVYSEIGLKDFDT
jgi:hypothetical protein